MREPMKAEQGEVMLRHGWSRNKELLFCLFLAYYKDTPFLRKKFPIFFQKVPEVFLKVRELFFRSSRRFFRSFENVYNSLKDNVIKFLEEDREFVASMVAIGAAGRKLLSFNCRGAKLVFYTIFGPNYS